MQDFHPPTSSVIRILWIVTSIFSGIVALLVYMLIFEDIGRKPSPLVEWCHIITAFVVMGTAGATVSYWFQRKVGDPTKNARLTNWIAFAHLIAGLALLAGPLLSLVEQNALHTRDIAVLLLGGATILWAMAEKSLAVRMRDMPFAAEGDGGARKAGNTAMITLETMIRAHQIHRGGRFLVLRIVLIVVGFVSLAFAVKTGMGLLMVVTMACWSQGLFADPILRRHIENQYPQLRKTPQVVSYKITADSLLVIEEDVERRIAWTEVLRWRDSDGLMLVYRPRAKFQVIPISQLDVNMQGELRHHLNRHAPNK